MKKIIAVIALLLSTAAAHAACKDDIAKTFELVRAEAIRISVPTFSERLAGIALRTDGVPDEDYGISNSERGMVGIHMQSCNLPPAIRDSIVAHEVGHHIANLMYPQLIGERRARIIMHSDALSDGLADQYGSRLLSRETNSEIVTISEQKCGAGDKWYCELHDSWLYGMTH